jgi:hypothetical protein
MADDPWQTAALSLLSLRAAFGLHWPTGQAGPAHDCVSISGSSSTSFLSNRVIRHRGTRHPPLGSSCLPHAGTLCGTTFDTNYAALDSLLAEWQSSKTYTQRISDLKHGGGLNGNNTLVVNTTVLGGGADTLKGKGPHDWFFEFRGDTILGFVPGEQIN